MTVYDFYWICMCIICPAVTVLGIIASIIGGVVYFKNKQNNSAKLPLVKKINHMIWGITGFSAFMIVILLINNQVFKEEFSDEKLLLTVVYASSLAVFILFSMLFIIAIITALVFPVIALIFIVKTIVAVIRYFAADKENKEEKESCQRIMIKSFLWDMGLGLAGIFIYYLMFCGLMSFH